MSSPQVTEPEPPAEPSEIRQTTPFLVLQFFVFPMAIVAVCVAVFVVFGLIASEGKSARDYLDEVRTGSANRRWQAAFELSKRLQSGKDPVLRDPKFAAETAAVFEQSQQDDPRVRRFLALALGRLGDRRAVPALAKAASGADGADSDTQVYAIWALAAIRDPAALPTLLPLARSDDAGVRKAAVHALGMLGGEAARAALVAALDDSVDDVRWNAALALARAGRAEAVPVLRRMLDRSYLASVPAIQPEQEDEALIEAIKAAGALREPSLIRQLEALRDSDSSPRVRETARASLSDIPH